MTDDFLNNPHDHFFKKTWSDKENVRSWLENILSADLLEIVRLESLQLRESSFVDTNLAEYHSDILYHVDLARNGREEQGCLYFLFEHKSRPEKDIPLQLLQYMTRIWQLERKQGGRDKKLPIIMPVIIYHGRRSWPYPLPFSALFSGINENSPLRNYIPDFESLLFDIGTKSDEEIKGNVQVRVFQLLVKYSRREEFFERLPSILSLLGELSYKETGLQYFETLLRYVMSQIGQERSPEEVSKIFMDTFSKREGGMVMGLAKRLFDDGWKKGVVEGKEEGREEGETKDKELGRIDGLSSSFKDIVITKFKDSPKVQGILSFAEAVKEPEVLQRLITKAALAQNPDELIESLSR